MAGNSVPQQLGLNTNALPSQASCRSVLVVHQPLCSVLVGVFTLQPLTLHAHCDSRLELSSSLKQNVFQTRRCGREAASTTYGRGGAGTPRPTAGPGASHALPKNNYILCCKKNVYRRQKAKAGALPLTLGIFWLGRLPQAPPDTQQQRPCRMGSFLGKHTMTDKQPSLTSFGAPWRAFGRHLLPWHPRSCLPCRLRRRRRLVT